MREKSSFVEPVESYNISVVGFSGPVDGVDIIDGIGKSSFARVLHNRIKMSINALIRGV